MLPHPHPNLEIQGYYQNKSRFNGFYSRSHLSKIKNRAYVVDRDKYKSVGTHWIALYVKGNNVKNFDSFTVEHIPKMF